MVAHSASTYIKHVQSHAADSWAASANRSATIDTRGFKRAVVILNVGAMVSGGTLDVTVEDSADDSTYAAITGAAFTQVTPANDNTQFIGEIDLHNRSRYIQVVGTGATQACEYGISVLLLEHRESGWQDTTYSFATTV